MLPAGEGSQHIKDQMWDKGSKGATTPGRKGEIQSNSVFPGFGMYHVITRREGKPIIHEMIVRSWLRETDMGMCQEDCVILYGFPAVSRVYACSGGLEDQSHFCMKAVATFSYWDEELLEFF